ncbi:hypothetical protein DIPPA_35756 [Diplonema papillatum]|nr:hypothetical protein DIPPA_35756 [Diplonema papillatum]|eukprot:gene4802-7406_t
MEQPTTQLGVLTDGRPPRRERVIQVLNSVAAPLTESRPDGAFEAVLRACRAHGKKVLPYALLMLLFLSPAGEQRRPFEDGEGGGSLHGASVLARDKGPSERYNPTTAEENTCLVCLANRRDTLIEDCQHLVLCWRCYGELQSRGSGTCPLCRVPITRAIFAYSP